MNKIKSAVLISSIIGASVMSVQAQQDIQAQDNSAWTQLDRAGTIKVISQNPNWEFEGVTDTTEAYKTLSKYASKKQSTTVEIKGTKKYSILSNTGIVQLDHWHMQTINGIPILHNGSGKYTNTRDFTPDHLTGVVLPQGGERWHNKYSNGECIFYANFKVNKIKAECTSNSDYKGERSSTVYTMTPKQKAKA